MPRFRVMARDASGNRVQQVVEAVNQDDARAQLRGRSLTVLSVVEDTHAPGRAAGPKEGAIRYRIVGGPPKPRLKSQDLVVFTRQFATMISSGIPMLECLDILTEQVTDPGFKLIMSRIVEDVRAGVDLSQALAKHPRVFSDIYVNMIRAGEASGQLDEILLRLAEYMESSEKLRHQIKAAMTYPVVSICLVLLITIGLLVFIIPRFESMFENLPGGRESLPSLTKGVLAISRALIQYWWAMLGGIVGIIVLIRVLKKTDNGAYFWDRMKLKLPIFGPLVQKIALSRFSRTFSTLLRSGVNILGALDIVSATAGNRVVERAVNASRDSIRAGEPLARPLGESAVFPPMVVRMVAIGEKSGALESLLEKISQFYDEQVSSAVESLTALIEPLMIGTMGLLVGTIVLSVFWPILEMQAQMRK
jgi:type IV pilus assembly protein PilC